MENTPHRTYHTHTMTGPQVATIGRNGREVQWHPFLKDEFTIGRLINCDIQVDEPFISRLHCKISLDGNGKARLITDTFLSFFPAFLL